MADNDPQRPAFERRSMITVIREHPGLFIAAVIAGALIGGTIVAFALKALAADEEAPIRVRNGSIELYLLSLDQTFEPAGSSGNYKISKGKLFKEEFEVAVAPGPGAKCDPSYAGRGKDIVLTYHDENNRDWDVRLESTGYHTTIKPGQGVTLEASAGNHVLSFGTQGKGYVSRIQVGNGPGSTQCFFGSAEAVKDLVILNVPQ